MRIIISFILSAILFISCSKDSLEYQNDFERSYQAFQQFKKEGNNSYSYKTTFGSWTGTSTEYTFEVLNGVVVSRSFVYKALDNQTKRPEMGWTEETVIDILRSKGYPEEDVDKLQKSGKLLSTLEWKENKEELGSKSDGSNIWTLDQIYEKAKNEWLIKRKNADVYFENKNNDLISSAGYVLNGCQDDCFVGININSVTPLNN